MQITKNFQLSEFIVSRDYPELAKQIILNDLDKRNIELLAIMILQPIRDFMGAKIKILSGKRSYELNKKVRGAKNSDHLTGSAVDFTIKNYHNLQNIYTACNDIIGGRFGQFLYYQNRNFIHVSLPSRKHFNDIGIILSAFKVTRSGNMMDESL
jgi:uncharacterized protein YcbK (DUF882 family)